MILAALTIDELLRFENRPGIADEVVRRISGAELFTRSQVDDIEDREFRTGMAQAQPDAIAFLCGLMDGEHWREHLDDDTREWIKSDLLTLLEPMDDDERYGN